MHHFHLLQDAVSILRDLADAGFFVIYLDTRKILSESLLEPGVGVRRQIAVHQLVRIFMEDHGPRVFDRHVEHDEGAIVATLEQPGNFRRLSVKDWRYLPYFLGVPEGHDLHGNRNIHVRLGHQLSERKTHLLEMERNIPAALIAGIGDHGKVRRTYFHPLRVGGETLVRPKSEASQHKPSFEESHDRPPPRNAVRERMLPHNAARKN